MKKKLQKYGHKTMISAMVALWVVVTVLVLDLFKVEVYWPTFAVLNLLTLVGFTKGNIVKIFLSCFAGIGISLGFVYGSEALAPLLGASLSGFLMLFLVVFLILAFDDAFRLFLNVHTIIVFAFCLVNAHEFAASWTHTIASAALGGGVAVAGILAILKLSTKLHKKEEV